MSAEYHSALGTKQDAYNAPVSTAEALPMVPERIVARVRRHGRFLILPALLFIVTLGGAIYLGATVKPGWQQIVVYGCGAALILFGCILPYMSWLTRRTTITTRRVVMRSGVAVRIRKDVSHSRDYEIEVRRSPLQQLFRSGDVRLIVGEGRYVLLKDIARPLLVQSALQTLIDQSRAPLGNQKGLSETE